MMVIILCLPQIFIFMICKKNIFSYQSWDLKNFMKRFAYADQNHTDSNLLHLIYLVSN